MWGHLKGDKMIIPGFKWIITDWAGNICFGGISFNDFEDAEAWLAEKLGDDYETDREEYYIVDAVTSK